MENITRVGQFSDAEFYQAICSCQTPEHSQELVVEFDPEVNDVSLSIHSKIFTDRLVSWETQQGLTSARISGDYLKLGFWTTLYLIENVKQKVIMTYQLWCNGYVIGNNQFIFRNKQSLNDYIECLEGAKERVNNEGN